MVAGDSYRTAPFRLGGIALFDVFLTLIGAFILRPLHPNKEDPFVVLYIFIILILLAIPIHYAIGQNTQFNHYLGLSRPRFDNKKQEIIEDPPNPN